MATEQERNRGLGAYSTPGVDVPAGHGPAQIITSPPRINFKFQDAAVPSPLYITREDGLAVVVNNSLAGITINVNFRILMPDGTIIPHTYVIVPTANRARNVFTFLLTEGFLLSVQIFTPTGQARRGQTFCNAQIVRPATGTQIGFWTLFQDYLTAGMTLSWPPGVIRESTEGPGFVRYIAGTTPAAGADDFETVPTNARWRFISYNVQLTTGAAVANREVVLEADDGVTIGAFTPSGFIQAASIVHQYDWAPGLTRYEGAVVNVTVAPFPYVVLLAGGRIHTLTINIQAADQLSAINYTVEEWIET